MFTVLASGSYPENSSHLVLEAIDSLKSNSLRICLANRLLSPNCIVLDRKSGQKRPFLQQVIYKASEEKVIKLVKLLVKYGADVNLPADNGNTPMHAAIAQQSDPELLKLLLSRGARITYKDVRYQTLFDTFGAEILNSWNPDWIRDVSKLILEHGLRLPGFPDCQIIYFKLCLAILNNDRFAVINILNNSNNLMDCDNVDYSKSIVFAARLRHNEIAKILIRRVEELKTVFLPLIRHGEVELVKLCVEEGRKKKLDIENIKGVDNINGLHLACSRQNLEVTEYLLTNTNIDANARDDKGRTPIFFVLSDDRNRMFLDVLSTLLKLRVIDVNIQDTLGFRINPPSRGCDVLVCLLEHGYDINFYNGSHPCNPNKLDCDFVKYARKINLIDSEFANDAIAAQFPMKKFWDTMKNVNTEEYRDEVEKLKAVIINTSTSFQKVETLFDYLYFSPRKAARYSNNVNLTTIYNDNNNDFRKVYKHFGFILNYQYSKGARRQRRVDSASDLLETAMGCSMPRLLNEEILSHFSDRELHILSQTN